MLVGITFIFFILIIRVGWIQLYRGVWLQEKAVDQWTRDLPVAPKRGMIMDRNGKVLAQSASAETVVLRPSQIEDAGKVADELSQILEMDRQTIYEKATDKTKSEIWLKRQVTKEQANAIRKLNLDGVHFTEDSKRYYPMKNFLTQVIGFTSVDGAGLEGIEKRYDKYLKGIPGKIVAETDSVGRELPYSVSRYIAPQNGHNVVLTIDYVIQSFVEKAMDDAMVKTKAKKVEAVVMDPNTGEVLAIVNKPDYDLNNPPRNDAELLQELSRNSVVSDVYEPGSTFKIITAATGLEEKVVTPESTFFDPGYKMVDNERIKCWKTQGHGQQTFVEGVQNSCNPIFMEIALRLGKEKFYEYIQAFGFGDYSGIDSYGDEKGIVMTIKYVKNVDLARIGFGQTIAVTPIQLISAVSAVINGGTLMKPHLVKEIRDSTDGSIVQEYQPTAVRRVISKETSQTMRDILESVVREGSGANAYIPGYRVGGKTGTAQKYEDGKIVRDKHIASFVGFAPADDPKVVVLVVVDEPDVPVDFGSVVAAPYVKQILEDTLKYLDVQPIFDEEEQEYVREEVEVPDVTDMDLQEGIKLLKDTDLQYLVDGNGGKIIDQMPKPGAKVAKKSIMLLYVDQKTDEDNQEDGGLVEVPDVSGKSIVEANTIITSYGLQLNISGSGVAVSQDPKPGEKVPPGTVVSVEFFTPSD